MGNALGKNVAVLQQVPAKSVHALGALTHQEIPDSKHDAVRLLLFGLDRSEAHARPLRRFTDGLCVGSIVLFCRLMNGLTSAGAIKRTWWPNLPISRAQ